MHRNSSVFSRTALAAETFSPTAGKISEPTQRYRASRKRSKSTPRPHLQHRQQPATINNRKDGWVSQSDAITPMGLSVSRVSCSLELRRNQGSFNAAQRLGMEDQKADQVAILQVSTSTSIMCVARTAKRPRVTTSTSSCSSNSTAS